ncbi:MAG: ABC transporter ATP-binding protein [Verrucomicrobiae bacterium]|nr:ABC transporter ATP-binding protein [Verrucomicrobiae bacterium]MCP5539731.1 ABC transporter ATP-binding protein [Akkermansiaceae bacterium]MCP5549468.1 ABC transporter ATP-binding protein [Akkermansiaceae bacterium]
MIEARNLSMRYGDLLALDGLNLSVGKGEFFAFLGPNSAGKTTTIKLLTGLLKPTSGEAIVCGHDIQKDPIEAKRRIGYVPDVAEFYDKLTPVEFLAFIADLFEVEPELAVERADALIERFSLSEHARQRIENLSHGTRQRLAIASALLHEPEVIIIDEPMVGLDPRNARVVKEELKRKSREGVTVFLSTHLLNVAEELADRVGIVNHGRLLAVGTIEELRALAAAEGGSLEDIFIALTEGKGAGGND